MTIQELIDRLEQIKAQNGDLPVLIADNDNSLYDMTVDDPTVRTVHTIDARTGNLDHVYQFQPFRRQLRNGTLGTDEGMIQNMLCFMGPNEVNPDNLITRLADGSDAVLERS